MAKIGIIPGILDMRKSRLHYFFNRKHPKTLEFDSSLILKIAKEESNSVVFGFSDRKNDVILSYAYQEY